MSDMGGAGAGRGRQGLECLTHSPPSKLSSPAGMLLRRFHALPPSIPHSAHAASPTIALQEVQDA